MLKLIISAGLALLVSGCALTTDYVDLSYRSQAATERVASADRLTVQVTTSEGRISNLDRFSVKKNGYGIEMAPIKSNQDVQKLVQFAVESELSNRGFHIGQSEVRMNVEVDKFYSDFKVGFWSGNSIGEVTLMTQLRAADGHIVYSRAVTGEGDSGAIIIMSGENAKLSIEKALSAAVARLVSDSQFIDALLSAGRLVKPHTS